MILRQIKCISLLVTLALLSCSSNGVDVDTYRFQEAGLNEHPVNYYLDATSGDDNNDGTSSSTAWKSLDKINSAVINPGDMIFFKRGEDFKGEFEFKAVGTAKLPIMIDAYGEGTVKPRIIGNEESLYGARIYNSSYVTMQNLEIINKGKKLLGRAGLKIESNDFGIAFNIVINNITVRDVTGTSEGSNKYSGGILLVNTGKSRKTCYENLTIENCHIINCQRNGILWAGSGGSYCNRNNWYPNRNIIIRNNLLEQVPGDGIVPMGCDGALVEYNVMKDCTPWKGAAAGIWPWSSDNVTIQFNHVSGHQATVDGEAYDSDFNCRNTVIQYNYSTGNHGGFVLFCNNPNATYVNNIGVLQSKVRYNISINDGVRPTSEGTAPSACIHFSGDATKPLIEYNIIHTSPTIKNDYDYSLVTASTGVALVKEPTFRKNIFYAPVEHRFKLNGAKSHFEGNWYLGNCKDKPSDSGGQIQSDYYMKNVVGVDPEGYNGLYKLMEKRVVGGHEYYFVKKDAIEAFFKEMENEKILSDNGLPLL